MGFKSKPRYQSLNWCCNLFLALLCIVTFVLNAYYNGSLVCPHMYHHYANHTPNNIMNEYMTQVTIGSCLYWIWGVVYALLITWFIYVFYLLMCRQLCSQDNKMPLFSGFFWFLFIIINLLSSLWLYLFVHDHILISGIILLTLMILLYALNMLACRHCIDMESNKNNSNGDHELLNCELSLLKFLTLNGIPLYAMCCALTACLQWIIIFKYFLFHFSDNISCIISLAIFTVFLMLYWIVDFCSKTSCSHTWLSYLAIIYVFGAIITKHNSIGNVHSPGLLFSFILLILSIIMLFVKTCLVCCCYPKSANPSFSLV